MPQPCEQKDIIESIIEEVKGTSRTVYSIDTGLTELCKTNGRLAAEMREMTQMLTAHMIDNREYNVRIGHIESAQKIIFRRIQKIEDDHVPQLAARLSNVEHSASNSVKELDNLPNRVNSLESWKDKVAGMVLVFPAICAFFTFLLTIYTMYRLAGNAH